LEVALSFRGRFDIPPEMRLGGVAEQGYTMLYGESQVMQKQNYKQREEK
jgi:hypothetical protein